MTIVIADHTGMAADTRVYEGDMEYLDSKLYQTEDAVLGCAGNLSCARWFVDWYINKRSVRIKEVLLETKNDWEVLVYDRRQRSLALWNRYMHPDTITQPVTVIGSGQGVGYGAYYSLKKYGRKSKVPLVVRAVEIAIDHASGCGGEVHYVEF